MQKIEKLEQGKFYHIYNCGNNGENLFRMNGDYEHFIRMYEKYVDPVADTFAWVLMKNHFHILVRVKENIVYKYTNADSSMDAARFNELKWETTNPNPNPNLPAFEEPGSVTEPNIVKIPKAELHLSHLFNAYTKYFNPKYNRHGSLFEKRFKRKHINNEKYFRRLVVYIHNNPVHHGFVEHPADYPWSSYLTCISVKSTKLKRETVIGWFDDVANFKAVHEGKVDFIKIEVWLGL